METQHTVQEVRENTETAEVVPTPANCCATGCCTPESVSDEKKVDIEFQYLDLSECGHCQGTEISLEDALGEVTAFLQETGIEVTIRKGHVKTEEQAREVGFTSSPTIRVNGQDIQPDIKETRCQDCDDLCGDNCNCRVWVYQGQEYTAAPKGLIIDAILRKIYGSSNEASGTSTQRRYVPDNLKRFFAANRKVNTHDG